jgi:hypothetical protein
MRRKLRRAFAVAFVVGAGLAAVGTSTVTASAAPSGFSCPGGQFCGWDQRQGRGSMVVQVDANCVQHDIGSGGAGDRVTSYWNRTGQRVGLYDWTGQRWQLLAIVPNDARGDLAAHADNRTDNVWVCPPD